MITMGATPHLTTHGATRSTMSVRKRGRGRRTNAQREPVSTQPQGGEETQRKTTKLMKANGTNAPTGPATKDGTEAALQVRRIGDGNIRSGLEIEGPLVSGTGTATIRCMSNSSLGALRRAIEEILEERVQSGEIAAEGCLAPNAWGAENREPQVRRERSKSSTGSRERMRSSTHSGRSSG